MTTKLTVSIENTLVRQAKKYAQSKNTSLSKLIERQLMMLIQRKENRKNILAPKTRKLLGSVSLPSKFNYKKKLEKSIKNKSIG
jgi:hypothetical protein